MCPYNLCAYIYEEDMTLIPMPADLPDVVLNPNAEVVLKKRYLRKGLDGQPIETPRKAVARTTSDDHMSNY